MDPRRSTLFRRAAGAALSLALAAALPAARAADGAPLLHALFQDHAMLQRGQPIRVWGQARPGEQVQVELAGKRARARAGEDGRWEAQLPALEAGGPYALEVRAGGRAQRVEDVLLGDVWLCSGQSNMELQVWRSLDARAEIAGAGNDRIRLLTVPQTAALTPQADFGGPVRWQPVNPDSVRDFSAACYYFARELQKTVDVPMGLLNAAWGGSRIEAWTSAEALRGTGRYDAELDVLERYAADPLAGIADWGRLWQAWWSGRPGMAAADRP
ncbi:MAG TPA: sialate O-acetylesterase, partial [Pseudoxanthomonas sp.]|nr:sialate O-acetylesterase [Pseudoxanthomonas sp.]